MEYISQNLNIVFPKIYGNVKKKTASEIWLALLVLQATGIFARKKKSAAQHLGIDQLLS